MRDRSALHTITSMLEIRKDEGDSGRRDRTLVNTYPTNENMPVVQTASGDQSNTVSDSESESMEETEGAAAIELVINTEPANKNVPVVEIEPVEEKNLIDANVSVNEATLPDEMEQGTVVGTSGGGSLGWSLLSLLALLTASFQNTGYAPVSLSVQIRLVDVCVEVVEK